MTSSEKFVVPFRITLNTSFMLNSALLFMYLGAGYWLWAFDLHLLFKLVLLAALLVGLINHSRQYLFRNAKRAVTGLVWWDQDQWQLQTARGESLDVRLLATTYVNPWLIVLNFKPIEGGRPWSVVILPDSVDSTTFRRLSVKLKLQGAETVGNEV